MKIPNWKTASELAAVASIVLSLVYVGFELRENSAISRSDAYNTYAISVSENQANLALDPTLSSLMARAFRGAEPNEFTADEQFRISIFLQSILRLQEGLFQSVSEGILSEEHLGLVSGAGAWNNPFFRQIWLRGFRVNYTSEFVDYFESLDWNTQN